MKQLLIRSAIGALVICSVPALAPAQTNAPASQDGPAGRPGRPKWNKPGGHDRRVPGLSGDEAQQLAAAREKAKNDPTVRSLKEARDAIEKQLENAVNAAMLAADPGLAPTLEKVKQSRERAKGMRERFESLTPEQREQLKAARQAAKDDPQVAAAREKMKSADSPEARREAGRAMHEAMKAAMVKQNPDLAPLLEKLGPPPPPPHDGPGGPRPEGPDDPMAPPPGDEE